MTTKARLGTKMRGILADNYGNRGNAVAHLWHYYSPKARRDFSSPSDIQYANALLLECNPQIAEVDHKPPIRRASLNPDEHGTIFDAEALTVHGVIELYEVKHSSALRPDADRRAAEQLRIQRVIEVIEREKGRKCQHQVMTEKEIFANPVLVRNWFELIHWIEDARFTSLHDAHVQVSVLLHAEKRITFQQLLEAGGQIYVAAALTQVCNGRCGSDLDQVPFSLRTVFFETRGRRLPRVDGDA